MCTIEWDRIWEKSDIYRDPWHPGLLHIHLHNHHPGYPESLYLIFIIPTIRVPRMLICKGPGCQGWYILDKEILGTKHDDV